MALFEQGKRTDSAVLQDRICCSLGCQIKIDGVCLPVIDHAMTLLKSVACGIVINLPHQTISKCGVVIRKRNTVLHLMTPNACTAIISDNSMAGPPLMSQSVLSVETQSTEKWNSITCVQVMFLRFG